MPNIAKRNREEEKQRTLVMKLHEASYKNEAEEIERPVKQEGVDVNAAWAGASALHRAVEHGNMAAAEKLPCPLSKSESKRLQRKDAPASGDGL